jgi:WhiB family redox-sensing transcriptional regulator
VNPPLLADTSAATVGEAGSPLEIHRGLWQRHARCIGETDLFFAPDGETPAERGQREAVALSRCAHCPVREMCRATARERREIGVWGGETDEERAAAGYPPRNLSRRSVIRAARNGRVDRAG